MPEAVEGDLMSEADWNSAMAYIAGDVSDGYSNVLLAKIHAHDRALRAALSRAEAEREEMRRDLIEDRKWGELIGGQFFELEQHAGAYFDDYCLDEADSADVCCEPRQHEAAMRFRDALQGARHLIETGRAKRLSRASHMTEGKT